MVEYIVKRPLKRPPIHLGEIIREDRILALGFQSVRLRADSVFHDNNYTVF